MGKAIRYQYYVEGEDEKKLLEVLKQDLRCIRAGKVDIFNVIQNQFTSMRIRPLKPGTVVILVYDTDVDHVDILQRNIIFLQKQNAIKEIVCIPQVKNLEEELVYACQIKNVSELTHSHTKKDYKRDLIDCNNLGIRLRKCDFKITKFWSQLPANRFGVWGNDAGKIKLK